MSTSTTGAEQDLGTLLGLADLEPAEQEIMLARIGELVMESVMIRAMSEMTDEEAETVSKEVAACTDAASIAETLAKHIPNIDDLIIEESNAFREECVDLLQRVDLAS
jgi:hypothetical protein